MVATGEPQGAQDDIVAPRDEVLGIGVNGLLLPRLIAAIGLGPQVEDLSEPGGIEGDLLDGVVVKIDRLHGPAPWRLAVSVVSIPGTCGGEGGRRHGF